MDHTILTTDYIHSHIGETIDWYCFGYSGNLPYAGKCKLIGLAPNSKRDNRIQPVIEHLSGADNLTGSWVDYDGITLTYSDSGRPVYIGKLFVIYTLLWENPKYNMFFHDNTAMQYSIVHFLNSGQTLPQLIRQTTGRPAVKILETGDLYILDGNNEYVLQLLMI